MSIVNMFSFDQYPDGRPLTTAAAFANEGYDFDSSQSGFLLYAMTLNGRTWLNARQQYIGPYGNITSRQAYLYNRKLRDIFGSPSGAATKGVIACRGYISPDMYNTFVLSSNLNSIGMIYIAGQIADPDVIKTVGPGEHFYEFEFDFVKLEVSTYVDGGFKMKTSLPSMTLDTVVSFGIYTYSPQSWAQSEFMQTTDYYITYDNKDGTPSGRLGPVKVMNLPLEENEMPTGWSYIDSDNVYQYTEYDSGQSYQGHLLIPTQQTDNEIPGQYKLSSIPSMASLARAAGPFGTSVIGPSSGTVTILTEFAVPKKATGYALQSYSVALTGFFDTWTFQGSDDGTVWDTLDTRAGMGPYFNNTASKLTLFKIAPEKQKFYRKYRFVCTLLASYGVAIRYSHFNIIGDMADMKVNGLNDGIGRIYNPSYSDMDLPVVKMDLAGSEGKFGFKVPDFGPADIMAIKVGTMVRREQGVSELMEGLIEVGAARSPAVTFNPKAHVEKVEPLGIFQKKPDGTAWTQADLEALRVVFKSKRGG